MKYIIFIAIFFLSLPCATAQRIERSTRHLIDDEKTGYINVDGYIYEGGTDSDGNTFILNPDGSRYVLGYRLSGKHYGKSVFRLRNNLNRLWVFVVYEHYGTGNPEPIEIDGREYVEIGSGLYEGGIDKGVYWIKDVSSRGNKYYLGSATGGHYHGNDIYAQKNIHGDTYFVYFVHIDRAMPKTVLLENVLTLKNKVK